MITTKVYVNTPVLKQEVSLLRNEKIKLDELYVKLERSKNELVSGNLSGKTNDICIKNNEMFIKLLKKRIDTLDSLITVFDKGCKMYEGRWNANRSAILSNGNPQENLPEGDEI